MVILGIYLPPKTMCGDYRLLFENELSDVVVVIGDLILDRLRPDKPEGNVLLDLEKRARVRMLNYEAYES